MFLLTDRLTQDDCSRADDLIYRSLMLLLLQQSRRGTAERSCIPSIWYRDGRRPDNCRPIQCHRDTRVIKSGWPDGRLCLPILFPCVRDGSAQDLFCDCDFRLRWYGILDFDETCDIALLQQMSDIVWGQCVWFARD